MGRELRPYQNDCHNAVISDYEKGILRLLIVLFTGAGKTYLLIKLMERIGFKRVLWLSFQTELVDQSAMAFIKDKFDTDFYEKAKEVGFLDFVKNNGFDGEDFKIGCVKADIFDINADVVMGSVQTITNRLDLIDEDYFDCIICDEAHLFCSKSAVNVLNYFKPKLLIGATATPTRADNLQLSDIFDKISYEYGLDRGIRDGWSSELEAVRIKTSTNLDDVHTIGGEFSQRELADEINTLSRNQLIVDSWKKYCEGRQTLAFCVDIKHA